MSDTHHFKETVNGGVLYVNPSTGAGSATGAGAFLGTGVYLMQLTDFPIFQRLNGVFEFVRVNKCTIEFIPKYNFQSNSIGLSAVASSFNTSTTGTLVTAIDQVPFTSVVPGSTANAPNWVSDSSNSSGTTNAQPYQCTSVTVGYVRGLQGSKEQEFYKKRRISFFPAFYVPIVGQNAAGDTLSYERRIKKWVTTQILNVGSSETPVTNDNGPYYYGPVYAFDCNGYSGSASDNINIALYDIRFHYSISFKRLRGV